MGKFLKNMKDDFTLGKQTAKNMAAKVDPDKTAETSEEREKRYQHRGSMIGAPIGALAMGLGNAAEAKSLPGAFGRGALGALSGLVLGDKGGQAIGSLTHAIKSKKGLEAPKMDDNKIASLLKEAKTDRERAHTWGDVGGDLGIIGGATYGAGKGVAAGQGAPIIQKALLGLLGGFVGGGIGGALGTGGGHALHSVIHGRPTGKELPLKEHKMASLLDPKSAVYFRSGQLHKIAGVLIGKDEVTLADAITKIATDAYIKRAEMQRVAEGLAALESI